MPSCLLLPPVPDLDRLLRCQAWPGVGGLADLFRCRSSSSPASSQASGRYFFLLISLVAWLLAKTVFAQHSVQAASELEYVRPASALNPIRHSSSSPNSRRWIRFMANRQEAASQRS